MTHTLTMFNTGQITLPKSWRERFNTKHYIAEETEEGLLIKPINTAKNETVYYENEKEFGIYCEKGLPVDQILKAIKEIHG